MVVKQQVLDFRVESHFSHSYITIGPICKIYFAALTTSIEISCETFSISYIAGVTTNNPL